MLSGLLVGCGSEPAVVEPVEKEAPAEPVLEETNELDNVPICVDSCGNGKCEEVVCMGTGCPCAETPSKCPEDCAKKDEDEALNKGLDAAADIAEECTSTIEPHRLKSAPIAIGSEEGIYTTENGFKFRVYPMDENKELIPLDGNMGIQIWTTETVNGNIRPTDVSVFKKSKFLKASNVLPDCGSQEIEITFEEIKKHADFRAEVMEEDDMGVLRLTFIRSGASEEYINEIYGKDIGIDFIPSE